MEIITSLIACFLVVVITGGIVVGLIFLLDRSFVAGLIALTILLTLALWMSMYSDLFLQ